jgi:hypothetical protein
MIEVGDQVWAADLATGETGLFRVTDLFSRHVDSLLEVAVGDETIRVTEEHPFWVMGEGWVAAEDLELGDCVQTLAGVCSPVTSVELVSADTWVYNFTVAGAHTYFVGDGQWLVHNSCNLPGQYDIVPYNKKLSAGSGLEKHHGVMDVWAKNNMPGYTSGRAPAIVLTAAEHNATRRAFNEWRRATTGSITGYVDWANMSPRQAQEIADLMFDAANIPNDARRVYYSAFYNFLYNGQF